MLLAIALDKPFRGTTVSAIGAPPVLRVIGNEDDDDEEGASAALCGDEEDDPE